VRPLADVKDAIHKKIIDDRVATAARKNADDLLARLRKGDDLQAVAKSAGVSVESANDALRMPQSAADLKLPMPVREQAFRMPHPANGKPQFADVDLGNGVFAIVAVNKVQGGDLAKVTPAQRERLRAQMTRAYGSMATSGFIDILKAKTKIRIATDTDKS
jgi:peptidyl-prolyl cis-trans isomerase D